MANRPLRIAVWYNLPSGGAKRALYNHLKGLRERGHTVEAFRPPLQNIEFMPISEVADQEHEFPWPSWAKESSFYPKALKLAIENMERYIEAGEQHAKMAAEAISKGGFDILFANTCMVFQAPQIGRFVDLPKLLYLQEPYRPLYEPLPRLPWIQHDPWDFKGIAKLKHEARHIINVRSAGIQALSELNNAKAFDRILVNSYFSREAVLRAYGISARVCYLGIDPGMFANHNLPRENFVIGVGTLGPTKNVLLAIEALGFVPKPIRPRLDWVANIVSEPYLHECEAKAREVDVEFAVHRLIPDEELVSMLNRAMLTVYSPRLEPFGYAPLEAALCGLTTVGVAEGGVRETVVDGVTGLLVNHDPKEFGAAITKLLTNPDLRASLAAAAEKRAQTTWRLDEANDRLEQHLIDLQDPLSHLARNGRGGRG